MVLYLQMVRSRAGGAEAAALGPHGVRAGAGGGLHHGRHRAQAGRHVRLHGQDRRDRGYAGYAPHQPVQR